ncbi:MAG: MCE family protein [Deltaproteobacteria bacterium]|nr:MCE family protein [Deltaproteobacteria bacterium]
MHKVLTPLKVGVVIVVTAVILAYFIGGVSKSKFSASDSYNVFALFDDVTGLVTKSRVVVAGVAVGQIEGISLKGRRGKVLLRIGNDIPLFDDATITKRSSSILGDYYLEIQPGTEGRPRIRDGSEITNVLPSLKVEDIFGSLNQIAVDIKEVTGAMSDVFGSKETSGSLKKIVADTSQLSEEVTRLLQKNSERLDRILSDIETVTSNLRGMSEGSQDDLGEAISNLREITKTTKEIVANIQGIVGRGEGDLKEGVSGVKEMVSRLNRTLESVEKIAARIEKGEGNVGKLLKDEKIAGALEETADAVSEIAGKVSRLRTIVSMRSEYNYYQRAAKSYFSLALQPKEDKYYLIELIDDPRGNYAKTYTRILATGATGKLTETGREESVSTPPNTLKISAEFAKRFYFATFRVGIIESSGGGGLDLDVLRWHFTLRTDVFELAIPDKLPRIRTMGLINIGDHIYVVGGADDLLNYDKDRADLSRDFFFGAGVRFTDDDLKSLFTVTGNPVK